MDCDYWTLSSKSLGPTCPVIKVLKQHSHPNCCFPKHIVPHRNLVFVAIMLRKACKSQRQDRKSLVHGNHLSSLRDLQDVTELDTFETAMLYFEGSKHFHFCFGVPQETNK